MSISSLSDKNRFINGVLMVVAVALLAASIYSVYLAWRTGQAQSRAETASRLMAVQTSARTTETPGIDAWVSWALLQGAVSDSRDDQVQFKQLVKPKVGHQFPNELRGLLDALRTPVPPTRQPISIAAETQSETADSRLEFRDVRFVENQDQRFVLTARQDEPPNQLEDFASWSSSHLFNIHARWKQSPDLPNFDHLKKLRSIRVARFYVLSEDESFISLPLQVNDQDDDRLYLSEREQFRKNPLSPSFVSNNFFFNFQFEKPLRNQAFYSGLYLDFGGLGLVASVTTPVIYAGKRAVLGADVAFELDWETFSQNLSPKLTNHVAHIKNADTVNWSPWNEFSKAVTSSSRSDSDNLKSELSHLAELESRRTDPSPRKSVYLATARDGGDVMAIQVDRSTWLLLLVSATGIQLPWMTMLLTSVVFLSLLFRIEHSRRQAVVAQKSARNEMLEKQNLLETMQVPLMVVDPNTDQVVFCNRAAETIGMTEGDYFGRDIVAADEASQEHYRKTQTLSEEHRRAYGVTISTANSNLIETEQSEQKNHPDSRKTDKFAIVRSVAVTAPIETLHADERHRLGIIFLIDEHRDLELLLDNRVAAVRQDEKRQLSSLMNHGIDSLARILKNRLLESDSSPEATRFSQWLSGYLSERIQLVAWVLENWGRAPAITDQRIIQRETVEMTVDRFEKVFAAAANDRRLREQLHWNNGVVSQLLPTDVSTAKMESSSKTIIQTTLDWSDDTCFAVPRDGVFGFLLSEALINAVRHGAPGTDIELEVIEHRMRSELEFVLTNEVRNEQHTADQTKPFGGTVVIAELARLSGWRPPESTLENDLHSLRWFVPTLRRKPNQHHD